MRHSIMHAVLPFCLLQGFVALQVSVLGPVADIDETLLCSFMDHPAPLSIIKTFLR